MLQEADRRLAVAPAIPLGTRGTLEGQPFDVIGFQRRSIEVDDIEYFWSEYTLFNPYRGFRYLSEYQGHWNVIRTIHGIPGLIAQDGRDAGSFRGSSYRHFQSATATTRFVLGEFPWRVRVGDRVDTSDYVSPPQMLSAERTDDEVTWSLCEYHTGAQIWKMFGLTTSPPDVVGVGWSMPLRGAYGARDGRSTSWRRRRQAMHGGWRRAAMPTATA